MSAASWDNAPAWAKWRAMDSDGRWHYFSTEPKMVVVHTGHWVAEDVDDTPEQPAPGWAHSAEKRP